MNKLIFTREQILKVTLFISSLWQSNNFIEKDLITSSLTKSRSPLEREENSNSLMINLHKISNCKYNRREALSFLNNKMSAALTIIKKTRISMIRIWNQLPVFDYVNDHLQTD